MESLESERNSIKKFSNHFNRVSWWPRQNLKVHWIQHILILIFFIGFNEAAWEKLDKLEGTEIDRDLLKKNLGMVLSYYWFTTSNVSTDKTKDDAVEVSIQDLEKK